MSEENNIKSNSTDERLNDIAPLLSKMNKSNAFSVPDDYFDNLPSVIQQKCIIQSKEKRTLNTKFLKPIYIAQYAFAVLFIFFGMQFLMKTNTSQPFANKTSINNSSYQYSEHFLLFDEDIDETDLADAFANSSEIEFQPITITGYSQINNNDIINYLVEESDDNNENIY